MDWSIWANAGADKAQAEIEARKNIPKTSPTSFPIYGGESNVEEFPIWGGIVAPEELPIKNPEYDPTDPWKIHSDIPEYITVDELETTRKQEEIETLGYDPDDPTIIIPPEDPYVEWVNQGGDETVKIIQEENQDTTVSELLDLLAQSMGGADTGSISPDDIKSQPSLNKSQLLAITHDCKLLWNIAKLPIEQQLIIIESLINRLRNKSNYGGKNYESQYFQGPRRKNAVRQFRQSRQPRRRQTQRRFSQ